MRLATPVYRVAWLAAAGRHGLLARLAAGRATLDELLRELNAGEDGREALEAWLELGVRLGEIAKAADGYHLRGFLARRLASPEHDAIAALLEEIATLHLRLVFETPALLSRGERWGMQDQDGVLIARSSRMSEPFVQEAVDRVLPIDRPMRLLEVGAGSGTHMRYACERNPRLEALGLELQPDVAEAAKRNLAEWGLADRVRVEAGDVREREPRPEFDLVTLHNNIYYFAVSERGALFRHLHGFLRPGGRVLVTTGCRGGSPFMHVLDIWSTSTEGCGRLPHPEELQAQLREAGFDAVAAREILPRSRLFAFWGSRR